jgi:hypothetical protein
MGVRRLRTRGRNPVVIARQPGAFIVRDMKQDQYLIGVAGGESRAYPGPDFDVLLVPEGASFTIRRAATGELLFDSRGGLARLLAELLPAAARPDQYDCMTLGVVAGRLYAYVGFDAGSRILVLDLTDPAKPEFVDCFYDRASRGARRGSGSFRPASAGAPALR